MKLKKFNNFISESVTVSDLENTKIGRSVFEYRGEEYRLGGYLYVYYTEDGHMHTYAAVDKSNANAVSGSGVGGCIAKLDDVTFLDRTTSWSDEMVESKEKSHKNRVEQDKDRYNFIKSMPVGLTKDEYEDIALDRAVRSAMKSLKNKN